MNIYIADYNDTFRGHGLKLTLVIQARDFEAAGKLLFNKLKRYGVGLQKPRGVTYENFIEKMFDEDVELTMFELDTNPYVLDEIIYE